MEQTMDAGAQVRRPGLARRMLRALLWTLAVLTALAALLAAVVLWMNRADEAPSADARALEALVASARPVAPADDALAALVALEALRAPAGKEASADARHGARPAFRRSDALDAAFRACDAPEGDCAALLAAAEADMPAWIAREQALLDGYRRSLPRRGWYEPPPPATLEAWEVAQLGTAIEAQRLHHVRILLDARAGDVAAVREALDADFAFWRAALAGSRTLITKMVATRALHRHFEFGAHALARLPAGTADAAMPSGWGRAFTPTERSVRAALAWEWKLGANALRDLNTTQQAQLRSRNPKASLHPLLKLQATSNRAAARMQRIARTFDVPHAQLPDALRVLDAEIQADTRWPYSVYNPVGRILDAIAAPAYFDYGLRVADLEGQRRAAMAVAALHRAQVPATRVADVLAASEQRDPYTGAAFAWAPGAQCVRTAGRDRAYGRRCLFYGRAPAARAAPSDAATVAIAR